MIVRSYLWGKKVEFIWETEKDGIEDKEYTVIEARVYGIFLGSPGSDLVKLSPFRQYSDGSVIVEPDFIAASLDPYTNETPAEEWNRTFAGVFDCFGCCGQFMQQTRERLSNLHVENPYQVLNLWEQYMQCY